MILRRQTAKGRKGENQRKARTGSIDPSTPQGSLRRLSTIKAEPRDPGRSIRTTPRKNYAEPPLDGSDLFELAATSSDDVSVVVDSLRLRNRRSAALGQESKPTRVIGAKGRLEVEVVILVKRKQLARYATPESEDLAWQGAAWNRTQTPESNSDYDAVHDDEEDQDYDPMAKYHTPRGVSRPKPSVREIKAVPLRPSYGVGPALYANLCGQDFRVDRDQLDYFFYWCSERDKVLHARLDGRPAPWSKDPIFNIKFSNLYRHQDRVSQYMLKEVVNNYEGEDMEDCIFRVLLFSAFDRITTWEGLVEGLGEISWRAYNEDIYAEVLRGIKEKNQVVFTGAYQVHPDKRYGSPVNYVNALRTVEKMMKTELPRRLSKMTQFKDAYEALNWYWGMGPFHCNQRCLDLEYTPYVNLSSDYIVCGPGAIAGNLLIFPDLPRTDTYQFAACRWLVQNQSLHWERLGRTPYRGCRAPGVDLADVEHALCEVQGAVREKMRLNGGGKPKEFRAAAGKLPALVLPEKWRLAEVAAGGNSPYPQADDRSIQRHAPPSPYLSANFIKLFSSDHCRTESTATANRAKMSERAPVGGALLEQDLTGSPLAMSASHDGMFTPRPEFNALPTRHTPFALLSLSKTSSIRALGFSSEVYMQLHAVLKVEWPEGVEYATLKEGDGWTAVLNGNPWKKQGNEELESIRLILGIFSTLADAGWSVVDNLQVGASKKDSHGFLFSWKEATEAQPPRFFALSFPMPDRISIIDCPSSSTPAIISAVRSSILTSTTAPLPQPQYSNASSNAVSPTSKSPSVTWARAGGGVKIKDEGWVPHADGVYSFAIGGYGSWFLPGGGVDATKYDNSHPSLLLSLLHKIDKSHFALTASVPLLPFKKRRDILIFHSVPSTSAVKFPSIPPSPQMGHQSILANQRKPAVSEGRSTPPVVAMPVTGHSRQPSAPANLVSSVYRVGLPPPVSSQRPTASRNPSSQESQKSSIDRGRDSPLPVGNPIADAFMRMSPTNNQTALEPIISGVEQSPVEPDEVVDAGPVDLQRRDTASSWVFEDHPDVIPGPTPIKAPVGEATPAGNGTAENGLGVVDNHNGTAETQDKGTPKERGGRVLGIFGRKKKSSISEKSVERGRRSSNRKAQARSETTYTEPGLAGVGAYLKLPVGKDNPHELARLDRPSEDSAAIASSEVEPVRSSPTDSAKGREGPEDRGKFHEQFRDTLEIPIEWVGNAKLAKVRQDTLPQSVQEDDLEVGGSQKKDV